MPRLKKCRRICSVPDNTLFAPETACAGEVLLSLEEYEAIRLSDFEGLEQDAAALQLLVSRGTYQRILYAAHHKVAEALTTAKAIRIAGGHYEVMHQPCDHAPRCKHCCHAKDNA